MKKEYDFSRAKRASFQQLPSEPERARHTKVRITILLDQDVLAFFKARAAEPGAEPYQTQINRVLREHVSRGGPPGKGDLLRDQSFISQLAERVAEYSAGTHARRSRPPKARGR